MGLFDRGKIEALRQDFDKRLQEVEMEKSKQILEVEKRMVEISEKKALEKANEIHSIWLEEFEKANGDKDKKKGEDLDAKSLFIDPYQMLESVGYRERPMMLGFDQLRLMSERNPIIAAVINTRVNQIASFSRPPRSDYDVGFKFYMRDIDEKPTKADERRMKELTAFCDATGFPGKVEEEARDVFDSFLRKTARDSLTYDQMCYEIVPSKKGTPGAFYGIDASTIRLATTPDYWRDRRKVGGYYEKGKDDSRQDQERMRMLANWTNAVDENTDPMDLRYVQILMGKVINTYTEKELCFGIRNPRTSVKLNGYGTSELEILVNTVVAHMWTEEHNRKFFSAGCLSGSTPIYTKKGIFSLQELYETNNGLEKQIQMLEGYPKFVPMGLLWNGNRWVEFDIVESGFKTACRTILEDKSSIISSEDHNFAVLRDGKLHKIPWRELKVGDFLPQARTELEFEKPDTGVETKGVCGGYDFTITEATPKLWEIVGWLVGDGYASSNEYYCESVRRIKRHYSVSLGYAEDELDIKQKHEEWLTEFGIKFNNRIKKCGWGTQSTHHIEINNKSFHSYLINVLGVTEEGSVNKVVPSTLFSETVENRKAFLQGLFGADGKAKSINKNGRAKTPYLTSASKCLLGGVQHILYSLGIASSIDTDIKAGSEYGERIFENSIYSLRIRDTDKFYTTVGFNKLSKQDGNRHPNHYMRGDGGFLPLEVKQRIARKLCELPELETDLFKSIERQGIKKLGLPEYNDPTKRGAFSRKKMMDFCKRVGITEFDELFTYRWVKIKSLKNSNIEIPMYDVRETDEEHIVSLGNCCVFQSAPKGIIHFEGANINQEHLQAFRRQWHSQIAGVYNAWRTPIIASPSKLNYTSLHTNNRQMEFSNWLDYLVKVICACYLIDPAEINFESRGGSGHQQAPMFESNNEAKQKLSRDRGLRPLLKFLESEFNKNVIYQIDPRIEFQFVGMDAKTEEQRQKLRTEKLQNYVTIDETRAEEDMKPLGEEKGGDLIMNTVYSQYMLQLKMQQQQQQQMGGMGGEPGQDFGEEGGEEGGGKYDFGAEGEGEEGGAAKPETAPGKEFGGEAKPETAPGREFGGGASKGEKLG